MMGQKETRNKNRPGLEVIKLEFILRLKIKRNDWLLAAFYWYQIFALESVVVKTQN